jgi:hypothetical protein
MFSKDLALKCLDLSLLTYSGTPNEIKNYGADNTTRINSEYVLSDGILNEPSTDTQWLFYEEGIVLYIAFRGSQDIEDWQMDFKINKLIVPFDRDPKIKKDKLHQGFLTCYMSIRDKIFDKIKSSGKKIIIITGHSLGAALATICSLDVKYNFSSLDVTQYSFGTPNVGNSDYAKGYNKHMTQSYFIRNSNDIVTFVPPRILGYVPIHEHIRVGNKGLFLSFMDHMPTAYYQNIVKFL